MTTVSDYRDTLSDAFVAVDATCLAPAAPAPGSGELTPAELTPAELTPAELTPAELTPAELTPARARQLAALLAPHLVSMRAVIAGTSYAADGGPARGISPATHIFIAGVLAGEVPPDACG